MEMENHSMELVVQNGLWCVAFYGDLGKRFRDNLGSNVVPLPLESTVPRTEALAHLEKHMDSLSLENLFPGGNSG